MASTDEKKTHNPKRFEVYKVINDGKSFELPDGKKFDFDSDGGWTDEYGNLYDKDGVPLDKDRKPLENFDEDYEGEGDLDNEYEDVEDEGSYEGENDGDYDEYEDGDDEDEDEDEDDDDDEDGFEDDDQHSNEANLLHKIIKYEQWDKQTSQDLLKNTKEIKKFLINLVSETIASEKSKTIKEFFLEAVFSKEIVEKELEEFLKSQIADLGSLQITQLNIDDVLQKGKGSNNKQYNKVYHLKLSSLDNLLRIIGLFGEKFKEHPLIWYPVNLLNSMNDIQNEKKTEKNPEKKEEQKPSDKGGNSEKKPFEFDISTE